MKTNVSTKPDLTDKLKAVNNFYGAENRRPK